MPEDPRDQIIMDNEGRPWKAIDISETWCGDTAVQEVRVMCLDGSGATLKFGRMVKYGKGGYQKPTARELLPSGF